MDDTPAPRPRLERRFVLRAAVSLVLLVVLILKVPSFDRVLPPGHTGDAVGYLIATCAVALLSLGLQAWRWQRVLAVLGDEVPLRTLIRHTLAGQFVGNVLPTTIGGDVLRVARLGTTISSSERAFASVVVERLTGWVALPLLVAAGFAAQPALRRVNHAWIALAIAGGTLVLLVALLFVAAHPRAAGRFTERQNWLRFLGAAHDGVDRLRRDPRRAFGVVVAAVVYQVSVVASVWLGARVVAAYITPAEAAAFVPAVAMTQVALPTINGLGAREGMLVLFFVPLGVGHATAITIGLIWYASTLIAALPGAPAFVVGHRKDVAPK